MASNVRWASNPRAAWVPPAPAAWPLLHYRRTLTVHHHCQLLAFTPSYVSLRARHGRMLCSDTRRILMHGSGGAPVPIADGNSLCLSFLLLSKAGLGCDK